MTARKPIITEDDLLDLSDIRPKGAPIGMNDEVRLFLESLKDLIEANHSQHNAFVIMPDTAELIVEEIDRLLCG